MSAININNNDSGKRILIAPLDWGLGHSTRMIPIIRHLLTIGCIPIIASDAAGKALLQKEFPGLCYIAINGYNIKYSKGGSWLILKLLTQVPKVLKQLLTENKWLKKTVIDHKIDGIISDNRPSCYHKTIPSIYITHQLQIFSPLATIRFFARKAHYQFINKFQECWVPDFENEAGIAGILSHPEQLPKIPVKYIGPLSRFTPSACERTDQIVAILSGPEPQRELLETMLLKILKESNQPSILIIGKPGKEKIKLIEGSLKVYNHLNAAELEQLLQSAKVIVARAGYSTIMDLLYLQKKAILIPTPGQSEQEYLAEFLSNKSNFIFVKQNEKAIADAMMNFEKDLPLKQVLIQPQFEAAVNEFVKNL